MTTVTTPTHPLTVTVYGSQALLGAAYLLGLAQATTMITLVGEILTDAWALAMLLSALTAVASVLTAHERIRRSLRAEMCAAVSLGVVSLTYEATLVIGNSITGVVTTQVYAVAVGAGCLARAWQIRRELTRIRREDG